MDSLTYFYTAWRTLFRQLTTDRPAPSSMLLVLIATVIVACAALVSLPAAIPAEASSHTDFVTTWSVDSDGGSITIPVSAATGQYTIDWGDGSADTTGTGPGNQVHTYASAGSYQVSISGGLTAIMLGDDRENAQKLVSIDQWGTAGWSSMESAFRGAAYMTYSATDSPNLSGVTDMSGMFADTSRFNGDLSGWDTSSVTDMSRTFYRTGSFNGDISDWDVSRVTDMSGMFEGTALFNGDLSGWDTPSVTDMNRMFTLAQSFSGGDLSDWDTSRVTNMSNMFAFAINFNGDISTWDTSRVTDMNHTFNNARVFNGDISTWDTSSVTDMSNMFAGATAFAQNLGPWYVTLSKTNFHDSSYAANIGAQNSFLRGHGPSYSFVSGAGCTDNGKFAISNSGVLTIRSFPTQNSYSICIGASGDNLFGTGNERQITLTRNISPTADAGPDRMVHHNTIVYLNGSGSHDPDGDALSYKWTTPNAIILRNANFATAWFTSPDTAADFTFVLRISDGAASSTDTVVITVGNPDRSSDTPTTTPTPPTTTPTPPTTTPTPPTTTPTPTLPAAPSNLAATSTTNTVTLTWDDPGDSTITGYKILSRITATQPSLTALVSDTGTAGASYTARNLESDTEYQFAVQAINGAGNSALSQTVTISTKNQTGSPPPTNATGMTVAFKDAPYAGSVGQRVSIVADLANGQASAQGFLYIVQILDADGATVSLGRIANTVGAGQTLSLSSSWIPREAGTYSATAFVWEPVDSTTEQALKNMILTQGAAFVWDSADNPAALLPPVTATITVS